MSEQLPWNLRLRAARVGSVLLAAFLLYYFFDMQVRMKSLMQARYSSIRRGFDRPAAVSFGDMYAIMANPANAWAPLLRLSEMLSVRVRPTSCVSAASRFTSSPDWFCYMGTSRVKCNCVCVLAVRKTQLTEFMLRAVRQMNSQWMHACQGHGHRLEPIHSIRVFTLSKKAISCFMIALFGKAVAVRPRLIRFTTWLSESAAPTIHSVHQQWIARGSAHTYEKTCFRRRAMMLFDEVLKRYTRPKFASPLQWRQP